MDIWTQAVFQSLEGIMKVLKSFVTQYESILAQRQKIDVKASYIHLVTLAFYLGLCAIAFVVGWSFDWLGRLGYLFAALTVVVILTFTLSRIVIERKIILAQDLSHQIIHALFIDIVYLMATLLTTSLLLLVTVYRQVMSPVLLVVFLVLFVVSMVVYILFRYHATRGDMPAWWEILLNGLFLMVLFYALSMLLRIHNIALSMGVVVLLSYALVELRLYLEQRFVFRISRLAVVGIGSFLILLSFPFNRAFNFMSVYRGEFTFRMVYEELVDPVHVFDEDVTGDVLMYDGNVVIVDEDTITFYDDSFRIAEEIDNEFESVYELNGRLLANKTNSENFPDIDLYEWNGTDFVLEGSYFVMSPSDKVYLSDRPYLDGGAFVYERPAGSPDYIKIDPTSTDNTDKYRIEETEDFLVFDATRIFQVTPDTFMDSRNGYIYEQMAYHNGYLAIIYAQQFVIQNPGYVDPTDDGKVLLYLANTEDYFANEVEVPPFYEMHQLFRIRHFYHYNNEFYLVGYVMYSTGEDLYRIIVLDEEANVSREIVFDGPRVAMSDEYIVFGDERLEVYELDASTDYRYRMLVGYGFTWMVTTLVMTFAVEPIRLKIRPHEQ
jgi:hypothetical protein